MKFLSAGLLAAMVVFGGGATTTPASATGFCPLKRTSDGFVALRTGPSATAPLVGRMRSSDEVLIGLRNKGNWVEVTWWRGQDRHNKGYHHVAGRGWANARLIEENC